MEKFDFALFYSPPAPSLQVERGNTKGVSKKKGGGTKNRFHTPPPAPLQRRGGKNPYIT